MGWYIDDYEWAIGFEFLIVGYVAGRRPVGLMFSLGHFRLFIGTGFKYL